MANLPEKIGKYPIIGTAGRGNMGLVYIGYDPFQDRDVAVKVCKLRPEIDEKTARITRKLFFNEAHMAGVLDHPNILRILDAGEENGEPYIVMEYVDGGTTLASHCAKDCLLPVETVGEMIFKCAKALDYAHRRGVIHRDIKPSNLMLTSEGDVKIGDFGIAHLPMDESTHVMGIMGSPMYMSPEQVQDERLTFHTDLYSLGVVMYELLVGFTPFRANNFPQLVKKITNEEPKSPRELRGELSAAVDGIVKRAMSKDRAHRYQSGSEMASDLLAAFPSLGKRGESATDEDTFRETRKLALFNDFSDDEVHEVLRVGDWETYGPGDIIITEGTAEYSFCILVAGDVVVRKRNLDITNLSAGDCFGEMNFLKRSKRTASILALNDVALLRITESQMEHALESCQKRFNRVFLRTLVERLERTSEELTELRDARPELSTMPPSPLAGADQSYRVS